MNATTILFDRYKDSLQVRSDRQAALNLGVKVQTVSNWRTRGSQAEASTIDAMCKQLAEDPTPWLLRIQAEQGGAESRNGRVWRNVAVRLGVALPALALLLDTLIDASAGNFAPLWDGSMSLVAQAAPLVQAVVPSI
ncbi:MAG TPA: hypothetical protein VF271_01245 [Rhodanobacteraceae bacterium]